jgi:hypothetical protein
VPARNVRCFIKSGSAKLLVATASIMPKAVRREGSVSTTFVVEIFQSN